MISVNPTRRRAEAFDAAVRDPALRDRVDSRDAEFLDLVASLREVPPVQARPEFVAALREQLMAAADTALVPGDEARLVLPARRTARDRRIAVAVGGLALVGATTPVAMAAQSALPGDLLYPVKRAIENVEASLAPDEGDKGTTLLASASGRLDEVRTLSREGDVEDGAAIAETLTSFTEQSTEASELLLADYADTGSESSVSQLRDFIAESMDALAELEGIVPADARDELLEAARALTQIDTAAAEACPSCGALGITDIPRVLTSAGFTLGDAPVAEPVSEPGQAKSRERDRQEQVPVPPLPSTAGQLPPGSVLGQPPAQQQPGESDEQTGDSGTQDPASNPLGDLTEELLGQDGSGPASNDPALPGTDEIEDLVEGVIEPLLRAPSP